MQLILRLMFSLRLCISGVMIIVLASNAVDRGFEPRSSQTKDYKIGICCFSAKYAALRRTSRDWLARNHNNVSEWSDMYTRGLLFQWTSTIKMQLSVLVLYKADVTIIAMIINLFSSWYNFWLLCLGSLIILLRKTFKLLSLQMFWIWAYIRDRSLFISRGDGKKVGGSWKNWQLIEGGSWFF